MIDVVIAWWVSAAALMGLWQLADTTIALNTHTQRQLLTSIRLIDFEGRFRAHAGAHLASTPAASLPLGAICQAPEIAWISAWCEALEEEFADRGSAGAVCLYRHGYSWQIDIKAPADDCQDEASPVRVSRRWQL